MIIYKKAELLKLLDSNLVNDKKLEDLPVEALDRVGDPVRYLVTHGLVRGGDFYRKLAELFGLLYTEKIDIGVSSIRRAAYMVPPSLLIQHQIYVQSLKNDDLIIYAATPFVDETCINTLLRYTGSSTYDIVITTPAELSRVLQDSFYKYFSVITEHSLHATQKGMTSLTYKTMIVPGIFPILILFLILFFTVWKFSLVVFLVFVFLNVIYFLVNLVKFFVFRRSGAAEKIFEIPDSEVQSVEDGELPIYSLLVPLRDEAVMVPKIVENLKSLEYPAHKIDVKFIVEYDDRETIEALHHAGIGIHTGQAAAEEYCFELIRVPPGRAKTKPRACNYALAYARGAYTVIYDAEDKPDLKQLKIAYCAFMRSSIDTACVQARLNFYNIKQNILTRLFAIEYGFWFDRFLPGLELTSSPIPLGGTSNHFVSAYLKRIGTWDAFNVTEDADLGLRIFRQKMRTTMINSYTLEEANSRILNWIRQRTRWQKGFLMTFLVHLSNPRILTNEVGMFSFFYILITFGVNFFLPFFNPYLWLIFVFAFVSPLFDRSLINSWISWLAIFNLFFGNAMYMILHLLPLLRKREWDQLPYVVFLPIYWVLISIATYRALWQFILQPYSWEKTKHGLS